MLAAIPIPETLVPLLLNGATRGVAALALGMAMRPMIAAAVCAADAAMVRHKVDSTLRTYAASLLRAALVAVAVLVLLGLLGVSTAPLVAVLAGATIAIGLAWGRLLGDVAAGAFLVLMPPFKVGDTVRVTGEHRLDIEGEVIEIGLFATAFVSDDNVRTIVANGRISGASIANRSARPYALHDRKLSYRAAASADALTAAVSAIDGVLHDPAPQFLIDIDPRKGPIACLRYACAEADAERVASEVNAVVAGALRRAREAVRAK
jgi:small conductance mechanosensitive channel